MDSRLICSCFVLICLLLHVAASIKLPSYIKACKADSNLDECALKSGRAAIPKMINGDPKYKVPKLDPFLIKSMKIDHGSKQIGLQLELKDMALVGLKQAKFTGSRMNLQKRHIEWDIFVPKVELFGNYKADGKVLVLPITGQGKGNITLINLNLTYSFDFTKDKKNGKEYINVKNDKIRFDTTRLYFRLENLFNGDKLLGDNMNTFLDENWREVITELGDSIASPISEIFTLILNNVAKEVPFDEVFLQH